jgi:phage gp36-like protein
MSRFLTEKDYDASVHREIIDAVTREDPALVKACEDRAVKDMRNYLHQRYDCNAIFKATGCKRDAMLVMFCVDIALYHLFCIHNPRNMPGMRKDRYDRAIDWLKAVGRGNLAAEGLPEIAEGGEEKMEYQITGERMRPTRR